MSIEYIRLAEVKKIVGLGTTKIYAMIEAGDFPAQVSLGGRAVAWVRHEVEGWAEGLARDARVTPAAVARRAVSTPSPATPKQPAKQAHNQLTTRTSTLPGAVYSAAGNLNCHAADVLALSGGSVIIGFGLVNVTLSRDAVAELVEHLSAALDAVGEALK